MITAFVGVGSNIDREKHSRIAVKALSSLGKNLVISNVYDCASVDFESAPFFNFVVQLDTTMSLSQFAHALREIEFASGREKNAKKFQDRSLDLDIILFGDQISLMSPQVPRDDIYKYPFVIQPLFELCPDLIIPNDDRSVRDIWLNVDNLESLVKVDFLFDGF